ncbi:putative reductase [Aquimixticola soesokkakensis]|uniref:Putative reductase n=1 Tax=Aquimixticola soesokkakensis TaxID=1519096 RepID=A0A1Y5SXE1_9RHOB|nr:ArsC/Spx/MgsR family protein [Aquimixticola soesokkakensis]SLN50090.1 putative reductase [Aquimixticola soesokkakensis]
MLIYGLKNCDTCRKASKMLGVGVQDVRETPVSRPDLERFQAAFGAALLNTRSTTWRGLSQEERALDPLDLIIAHPALMKRPVIEAKGQLWLGWGKDVQAALT